MAPDHAHRGALALHRAWATSTMRTPPRRNATLAMSWIAAPEALVTTPITAACVGSGRLAFGREEALGEQLVLQVLESLEQRAAAGRPRHVADELQPPARRPDGGPAAELHAALRRR